MRTEMDKYIMTDIHVSTWQFVLYKVWFYVTSVFVATMLTLAIGKPIEFIPTMFIVFLFGFFSVPLWLFGIVNMPLCAWYIAILWWIGAVWYTVRPKDDRNNE